MSTPLFPKPKVSQPPIDPKKKGKKPRVWEDTVTPEEMKQLNHSKDVPTDLPKEERPIEGSFENMDILVEDD